jgi:hypothetical protein
MLQFDSSISIADIISIAGIFLVFLTLREMEKQRRESYKPVIVIPKFGLKAKGKLRGIVTLFYQLYRGGIFEDHPMLAPSSRSEKESEPKWAHVILRNLGAGPAKNISAEWKLDFDVDEQVKQLKEFFYKNSIPIILEIKKGYLYVLENFNPETSAPSTYAIEPRKTDIDFLLPHSVEPLGTSIQFPQIYEKLIDLLATLHENQTPEWLVPELPIILDLRYRDIGTKQLRNQYRLRITRHEHTRKVTEDVFDFYALFEITQIR